MNAIRHLLFPLLLAGNLHAGTTQLWVDGVSQAAGWIDYEKTKEEDGDDNICWAASTSNILDYWQSLYITSSGIPTGQDIWNRFKSVSANTGGSFISGVQWWLGGDYAGMTLLNDDEKDPLTFADNRAIFPYEEGDNVAIKTDLDTFSGYYWEAIPDTYNGENDANSKQLHLAKFFWGIYSYVDTYDFTTALIDCIAGSPPANIAIVDTNGELAHALTLWGVEYTEDEDGTPKLSSIWVTDSDDYETTLRCIDTFYKNEDDYVYLKDYSSNELYGDVYISEAFGLNLDESDSWNLKRIPEPAVPLLAATSLLYLSHRRRRK